MADVEMSKVFPCIPQNSILLLSCQSCPSKHDVSGCSCVCRKRHPGLRERIGFENGRQPARDAQSGDGQPDPALGNHRPGRLHGNRAEHSESTDTYSGETRCETENVIFLKLLFQIERR